MGDSGRRRRRLLAALLAAGVGVAAAPAAVLEVGVDDQRISFLGVPGDVSSSAGEVAVALDPGRGRYLVIWSGFESLPDPATAGIVETRGLYAQRLDAATGDPIGERTQISTRLAFSPPTLLFDPTGDRWDAFFDAPFAGGVDILHLRLDGETAAPLGPAVAVQPSGTSGLYPDAKPSPELGEILVAWDAAGEIFVQRLDAETGAPLPPHGVAISSIGPPGDGAYAAFLPRVAWNAIDEEYLVVFLATPEEGPGVSSDHFEVHGQRLDTAASEIGADDFRVSAMGAPEDTGSSAGRLDVAFDDLAGDYLVAWEGNRTTPDVGPFEVEIYSQRLDGGSGAEIGSDDLRVTAVGGLGDPSESARNPRLIFDRERRQFLLSAFADTVIGDQGDTELRVHEIDAATGISRSLEGDALSQSGGPDDPTSRAMTGTIARSPASGEMIAVWSGEDDEGGMGPDEREVFAQRARPGHLFADGFESGDLSAWSAIEPGL